VRFAINNYTRQYWDEYTVFVENFDSVARIQANNGTIVGNFSICEGRFGNGGCFDGNSSYVDYGEGPGGAYDITNAMTVEAWVKPASNQTMGVLGKSDFSGNFGDYELHAYGSNWRFILNDNSPSNILDTVTGIKVGEWQHVAATYSQAEGIKRIYLDGVEENTQSFSGAISTTYSNLRVGMYYSPSYTFNGSIDEVRIRDCKAPGLGAVDAELYA